MTFIAVPSVIGVVAFAILMRLLVVQSPIRGNWIMQVMMAITALTGCCWGAVRRHNDYTGPLQRLLGMIPTIRAGEEPIDDLKTITGPIAPVADHLHRLFRDLRERDRKIAEMNAEMRQRVAIRTEALERAIGGLKTQATRDGLTGLNNRRHLDELLPKLIVRARDINENLSVLMIDVDNFKLLNDTRGHAAGDELLKTIAQLIRSSIRDHDVAFRCGGDEFVVVLPESSPKGAAQLAERLTSLVDAMAPTLRVTPPVRLSIGVSSLFECAKATAEGILAEADEALYTIKSTRDRVRRAG